jgi:hypothetical protein
MLRQLAEELLEDPNARGYILVYAAYGGEGGTVAHRQRRGEITLFTAAVKQVFAGEMNTDPDRVDIQCGGYRKEFLAQMWLLKNGANPPTPAPDAKARDINPSAEPFLEYSFSSPYGLDALMQFEGVEARLTGYAEELKANPAAMGYIIGYGACPDTLQPVDIPDEDSESIIPPPTQKCDKAGFAKRLAEKEKNRLVGRFGIAPARLVTIDGGFHGSRWIELWTIWPGEPVPKATPSFTVRRRK